ncbi:hypothetical protein CMK11_09695 [Candidatus Poribacteria bacterium]|nr:hypothetical protein [Candidatus Poribacteria bacterium]
MTTLRERDIEICLPSGARGRKFDVRSTHPLLERGWSGVDFIIEDDDRILFIEVKDPDDPDATEERRATFVEGLRSGALIVSLARKYRDSFLYEWASERVEKRVYYYVLIAHAGLDDAVLLPRAEDLKRMLPAEGPPAWRRQIICGVAILNMDGWNRDNRLAGFPVSRVSQPAE